MLDERASDAARFFFVVRVPQPDEGRIRIAVNDFITFGLNQLARAVHDFVAAHRYRRRKTRIEEAATGRAEHAVKRIHDDLQRLRKRLVVLAFPASRLAIPD